MTAENKTAKNIAIYSFMAFFQKGISFFLVPLYTYLLTPQEFGLANEIIAVTSFFILFFSVGLDEAAVRLYFPIRLDKSKRKIVLGTIILTSILISFISSLILLLFKDIIFTSFVKEISYPLILLSILLIGCSPLFVIYQKLLRIQEKAINYTLFSLSFALTQILLSICFIVYLDLSTIGYILAITTTQLIFFIISLINLKNEIYWRVDFNVLKDSFIYGIKVFPHTISGWFSKGFTLLAIGNLLDSFLVGIFNAMNFLAIIINVISKAILDAFQPWIYEKLEQPKINSQLLFDVAKFIGIVIILIGFFLSLFSNELIKILISKNYHDGIYLVPFLVYSSLILFIGSLLVYVLYYDKAKTHLIGLSSFVGAILNVVLCLCLIPDLHLLGAALSVSISNTITALLKQYYASKALKSNYFLSDLYFLAILNLLISYFLNESNYLIRTSVFILELAIIYYYYKSIISFFVLKIPIKIWK
jgi:O-antigen/teichoic acid export membrane protein